MIRFGALAIGLALVSLWFAGYSEAFRAVAAFFLVAGVALLLAGREPWPHCCEHCPVYADRVARAVDDQDRPATFEAAAIIAAHRAERAAATAELEAVREPHRHAQRRNPHRRGTV